MTQEQIRRVRRNHNTGTVTVTLIDGTKRVIGGNQFNASTYRSRVSYGVNNGRYDTQAVTA
ncbi:hypothetical protein AB0B94_31030 [Micromonospora sp. NPDC048986]|uniref:hypothetical protein n=1 Tax=Micromonospora sp. NPDC048986 TaxID=3155644 RepID=UPI0034101B49